MAIRRSAAVWFGQYDKDSGNESLNGCLLIREARFRYTTTSDWGRVRHNGLIRDAFLEASRLLERSQLRATYINI